MLVILILGSPADRDFAAKITAALDEYDIPHVTRIASAHKVPRYLLDMLAAYEADPQPKVYITVAGRSNALSGMVDASVAAPVIACPPYSDKFGGADVFSSLRTPSGVAPAVVLEPDNAALLAAKILGVGDAALRAKVLAMQEQQRQRLYAADHV
ncbi:MAG TPA: 5-(carboxyamino)imidazole ribonucleotide mutase [Anaerolineae bacterium]|nr:5-(carboxyamino)imidazole ribonucleotide mutase [Anaerolineae bacterium]HQK14915.1 5-(carboxyamino)imidazole ribonucleotide mutase [Anaerolineae bacterium]